MSRRPRVSCLGCLVLALALAMAPGCKRPDGPSPKDAPAKGPSQAALKESVTKDLALLDSIWASSKQASEEASGDCRLLLAEADTLAPEKKVTYLIEALRRMDYQKGYCPASHLASLGAVAVPSLVALLGSDQPLPLRKHAARALGVIGPDAACPAKDGLSKLALVHKAFADRIATEALAKLEGKCGPGKP